MYVSHIGIMGMVQSPLVFFSNKQYILDFLKNHVFLYKWDY